MHLPVKNEKPLWKKAYAYCPLCWWNMATSGRLGVWPDEFQQEAETKHAKEKPNCHETLRIEGQE